MPPTPERIAQLARETAWTEAQWQAAADLAADQWPHTWRPIAEIAATTDTSPDRVAAVLFDPDHGILAAFPAAPSTQGDVPLAAGWGR